MAVLEVLSEVIRPIELLANIALTNLVNSREVIDALLPIRWMASELLAAKAAHVGRQVLRLPCQRWIESGLVCR